MSSITLGKLELPLSRFLTLEERLEHIKGGLRDGLSYREIGSELDISGAAVGDYVKRYGLRNTPSNPSNKDIKLFTASEAARKWGTSPSQVIYMIKKGRIKAHKVGNWWIVDSRRNPKVETSKFLRNRELDKEVVCQAEDHYQEL